MWIFMTIFTFLKKSFNTTSIKISRLNLSMVYKFSHLCLLGIPLDFNQILETCIGHTYITRYIHSSNHSTILGLFYVHVYKSSLAMNFEVGIWKDFKTKALEIEKSIEKWQIVDGDSKVVQTTKWSCHQNWPNRLNTISIRCTLGKSTIYSYRFDGSWDTWYCSAENGMDPT